MSILDGATRRNLFLLACCQAIGQAGSTLMLAATALSVVTFYHNRDLATLPVTLQHLGIMIAVFPAAALMQRMGRRFVFRVGSFFGMVGGAIVALGLYTATFALMCLGGLVLGFAVASLPMYRFAAVELVPASYRAKAISWVTAGGVAAGIIGPNIVRFTYDQILPLYLAAFIALIGIHAIVFIIMGFINFPPPKEASVEVDGTAIAPPRPLLEIASQPRFIAAVISGMVAFGVMSFLMSASPLAIVACGLPHMEAHWVIFMHVMGMFVPSFFTGNLITRYGTINIMLCGIALLLLGVFAALAGNHEWHFRISLTLNGIGWNFLFIGATNLVTTCYRPNERFKVQALNDFLIFGTTAIVSFLAGFLHERLGWVPLNFASIPLLLTAVLVVTWLRFQREQTREAI
jgi:MFS family permease